MSNIRRINKTSSPFRFVGLRRSRPRSRETDVELSNLQLRRCFFSKQIIHNASTLKRKQKNQRNERLRGDLRNVLSIKREFALCGIKYTHL